MFMSFWLVLGFAEFNQSHQRGYENRTVVWNLLLNNGYTEDNDFPSARVPQQVTAQSHDLFHYPVASYVTGKILGRHSTGNHSSCEFMMTMGIKTDSICLWVKTYMFRKEFDAMSNFLNSNHSSTLL